MTRDLQFTLNLTAVDPSWYGALSLCAERLGFCAVSVGDSLFYPRHSRSRYPYSESGSRTFLEDLPILDPMVALSFAAAATSKIRVQTSVTKLSVRHPVLVAKQAASLAVASGNRLTLGVGTSPWPEDYDVLGVPRHARGARFEEAVDLVRRLTSGGFVEAHGAAYDIAPIKIGPVPDEPIPILIGGHGPANLERAARLGDGWIGATTELGQLEELVSTVLAARRSLDGEHRPFQIHASGQRGRDRQQFRRLRDIGVTHISVRPAPDGASVGTLEGMQAAIEELAAESQI